MFLCIGVCSCSYAIENGYCIVSLIQSINSEMWLKKNVSIAYGKSVFTYGQILELLLYYTFFWSPRSKHSFAQNRVLKKNSQGLFCKFGNGLFCRIYLGFYEHDILSQNLCTNSCWFVIAPIWQCYKLCQ